MSLLNEVNLSTNSKTYLSIAAFLLLRTSVAAENPVPDLSHREKVTIAFGSCIENPRNAIWRSIAAKGPDLLLFLGDNIYLEEQHYQSRSEIESRYRDIFLWPGLRSLIEKIPSYAIWDDHDFGADNSDSSFPHHQLSRKAFISHWRNPGPPPGLEASIAFKLQFGGIVILMTDNRSYRINSTPKREGVIFGKKQLNWIVEELLSPEVDVVLLVSGHQLLSSAGDHESMLAYPTERKQLLGAIRRASGKVAILSGDLHYAEILEVKLGDKVVPEITASPFAADLRPRNKIRNEKLRRGVYSEGINFGTVEILRLERRYLITLRIHDRAGKVVLEYQL